MTVTELQELIDCKRFHHATYRNLSTVWEGLYIYENTSDPLGFALAGVFHKTDPYLIDAYDAVRSTGVSVGGRGECEAQRGRQVSREDGECCLIIRE